MYVIIFSQDNVQSRLILHIYFIIKYCSQQSLLMNQPQAQDNIITNITKTIQNNVNNYQQQQQLTQSQSQWSVDHIVNSISDLKLVTQIQKHIRANIVRSQLKPQFKKIHRRRRILKQLIDTQQGYIRDLGFIVSDFKMRMKSRGILNQQQCLKIFSNVNQIRQLHDVFFSILYNHYSNYHPYLVIFKDVLVHIQYFRIYVEYLNNFPYACDLVEDYKKTKSTFAQFVSQISRSAQYRFLSIQDYMVMPIQRLPKYVLLLKQLLKNTSTTHPDYIYAKAALQKFQSVNTNNNEKLNKIRNSFKLRQMQTMLQLSQGIITQSTQFIMQQTVQILNQINNELLTNCVVYLLNTYIIVTRRCGPLLNRSTINNNRVSHAVRISRASGFGMPTYMKQKLQVLVPLKHGTSIKFNKDQCFYKNSFTVQSSEGQSCTFICSNQQQLHNLSTQIKKQIDLVVQQTIIKLKSMFQNDSMGSHMQNTFIQNIFMLDLVPQVTVLGTSQRTDKMLKYTVYIVEVKIKMVKQKIFLRFSELLELEKFITETFGSDLVIKQGLVSSSWLNNHQQKTIEQRKMNIQRFLKEILSKPQIIKNGWRVLLRLGLPLDFYELPKKISSNKSAESFIRKSTAFGKSTVLNHLKGGMSKINKISPTYRLSLFQQQKIQQQEEDEQQNEQEIQQLIKQSFHESDNFHNMMQNAQRNGPKSSYGSSQQPQTLCIQDILKANQIDLGHYTRLSQTPDYNENNPYAYKQKFDTVIELQVLVPCLQSLYWIKNNDNKKGQQKYGGFVKVIIKCSKLQRVQNIIPLLAKQINLKYYKDFRLLIQKQYSQRVLDDDELVHKILGQISRTKSLIFFRKVIYIDHTIQQKQFINDKQRLMLQSSQIINEIKLGKYRLDYQSYLKFAVLSAIVYQQSLTINQITHSTLSILAKQAKSAIFPKYSTLTNTQNVWIDDFIKAYRIISNKLNQIVSLNYQQMEKKRTLTHNYHNNNQNQNSHENMEQNYSFYDNNPSSFWVNTSIKYLAMLSIIKEIQKKQMMYGCVTFSVQISEQFKKYLQNQYFLDIQNNGNVDTLPFRKYSSTTQRVQTGVANNKSLDDLDTIRMSKRLSEEENKNCWLGIKHNKILFTSITKNKLLLQVSYQDIIKIQTYSSALILQIRNLKINKIKLKTTSSYYIREMLIYYRNYRSVLKKIYTDNQMRESVIGMSKQELGETHQYNDMEEFIV